MSCPCPANGISYLIVCMFVTRHENNVKNRSGPVRGQNRRRDTLWLLTGNDGDERQVRDAGPTVAGTIHSEPR